MNEPNDNADSLLALFAVDAPVPIRRLYGIYSESSFKVWRHRGVICDGERYTLKTQNIEALGVCVLPSVLKDFLTTIQK